MRQLGSLEFVDGMWCFVGNLLEDAQCAGRKWADEKDALSELEQEGWMVLGSHPGRLGLVGCALIRTVF
jgi:hypothetical protein